MIDSIEMIQVIWIDGRLPGLNELINFAKSSYGQHKYNKIKKTSMDTISRYCLVQKIKPVDRVSLAFKWFEPNMKRDPDNFTSAGKKIAIDSLVKCGILPNDGWKNITGWTDEWTVEKGKVGVEITIIGQPK